jgi:hypothetical protein
MACCREDRPECAATGSRATAAVVEEGEPAVSNVDNYAEVFDTWRLGYLRSETEGRGVISERENEFRV